MVPSAHLYQRSNRNSKGHVTNVSETNKLLMLVRETVGILTFTLPYDARLEHYRNYTGTIIGHEAREGIQ